MDFAFTDEQNIIRETAADFLREIASSEKVRTAMESAQGYDQAVWQRICQEMFWQGIAIPEEYGGLGLGYVELVAVLEEAGRVLLGPPFFATVCLGANALLLAGNETQKKSWLGALCAGELTATLGWSDQGQDEVSGITYTRAGDQYVLDGQLSLVADGHSAGLLIIAARPPGATRDDISLFAVPAGTPGLQSRHLPTMDQTRKLAAVHLEGARLPATALLGEEGRGGIPLQKTLDLARIALAAEQTGAAARVLEQTVAYTKERVQFNRPVAGFQAVKHQAADMMVRAETARSAIYYAACIADQELRGAGAAPGELAEAAAIAKSWCSDAFFDNAGDAIQLHGGNGFTWEYDIHLFFKRAGASARFLGEATAQRERLAGLILDDGGKG